MSILIKGMEMPIDCCDCPMSGDYRMCCSLMPGVPALYAEFKDAIKTNRRHKDCPLVPIPPHGDLIDRDAIKETFCGNCFADENPMKCPEPCMDMRIILDAPAIIPAEEGET